MTPEKKHMMAWLRKRGACVEGVAWAEAECANLDDMWGKAPHEYLRWICEKALPATQRLKAAIPCAQRCLPMLPADETEAAAAALDTALAYAAGDEEAARRMGDLYMVLDSALIPRFSQAAATEAQYSVQWLVNPVDMYHSDERWFSYSISSAVRAAGYAARDAHLLKERIDGLRRSYNPTAGKLERAAQEASHRSEMDWQVAHIRTNFKPNWELEHGL